MAGERKNFTRDVMVSAIPFLSLRLKMVHALEALPMHSGTLTTPGEIMTARL